TLGLRGVGRAHDRAAPLGSAAHAVVGPAGRVIFVVAAVVSMFGYLSASVLSEPRGLFALARDGFLPRQFVSVHPRFRSPYFAIVTYGVAVAAIAMSGTFERLASFASLAALLLDFLCAVSAYALRRRDVRTEIGRASCRAR